MASAAHDARGVRVSYAVMADRRRENAALDLDDELDCPIVWSAGRGVWETGCEAWRAYDDSADWHCVIQDDAVLCDDFRRRAASFLASTPQSQPVSFYLGTGRPRQRQVREAIRATGDASFIEMPHLSWGVAVALPVSHIIAALEEAHYQPGGYDHKLSRVYEKRQIPVRYSWPSLVDHRDEDSLLHSRVGVQRVAYWFAGREGMVQS